MAASLVLRKASFDGKSFKRVIDVTFDSSYPTGGEVIDFATLKGSTANPYNIPRSIPSNRLLKAGEQNYGVLNHPAGLMAQVVPGTTISDWKLKLFWVDTTVDGAAMAEVVNTTNVSTAVARIFIEEPKL